MGGRFLPFMLALFFAVGSAAHGATPPRASDGSDRYPLILETERDPAVPFEMPSGLKSEAIPRCDARVNASDEPYENETGTQKIYSVRICDTSRTPSRERAVFARQLGSVRLAEGSMWVKLESEGRWEIIHYRLPDTQGEADIIFEKGVKGLEQKTYVRDEDLPAVIALIPSGIREKYILFFFAYRNSSYEIFLLKNKKEEAERVAQALNTALRRYRGVR